MSCLITALTRSFIEKNYEKENKQKRSKNKNFTAKTKYLDLNAPSNNAKMQSYKTLTAQVYFVHNIQQMAFFFMRFCHIVLMRQGNKVDKRK